MSYKGIKDMNVAEKAHMYYHTSDSRIPASLTGSERVSFDLYLDDLHDMESARQDQIDRKQEEILYDMFRRG